VTWCKILVHVFKKPSSTTKKLTIIILWPAPTLSPVDTPARDKVFLAPPVKAICGTFRQGCLQKRLTPARSWRPAANLVTRLFIQRHGRRRPQEALSHWLLDLQEVPQEARSILLDRSSPG
jgi:hypothetical protein